MPVTLQSTVSPGRCGCFIEPGAQACVGLRSRIEARGQVVASVINVGESSHDSYFHAQQLFNGFLLCCGAAAVSCRGDRGRHSALSAEHNNRWYRYARLPRPLQVVSGNADHIGRSVNTQDCPEVEQRPSASLGAVESVQVQLDAIGRNDTPFKDHGVETMFAFCAGGGLTFSSGSYQDNLHHYFGYPKDLYHMDHYKGALLSHYRHLVDHKGYTIDSAEEKFDESGDSSYWVVRVSVQPSAPGVDVARFIFVADKGRRPGVYLTERLVHAEP